MRPLSHLSRHQIVSWTNCETRLFPNCKLNCKKVCISLFNKLFAKRVKHVSRNICSVRMFPQCFSVLSYGNHYFQQQNEFLLNGRNMFCFPKQCFLYDKTGKHAGVTNVSGNMLPLFSGPYDPCPNF